MYSRVRSAGRFRDGPHSRPFSLTLPGSPHVAQLPLPLLLDLWVVHLEEAELDDLVEVESARVGAPPLPRGPRPPDPPARAGGARARVDRSGEAPRACHARVAR